MNPQPTVEVPSRPEYDQAPIDVAHTIEENGYGDDYQDDNYDDDDDVDFNLGNGPANSVGGNQSQHDESTPAYHSTRGPSVKEDG